MNKNEVISADEETLNLQSITCTNIPDAFLDKLTAKQHFSRFGTIKNFSLRPKKSSCSVEYENTSEAALAKEEGNVYEGQTFNIEYTVEQNRGFSSNYDLDLDVQMELVAMRGGTIMSDSVPGPQFGKKVYAKKSVRDINVADIDPIFKKPAFSAEEKYRVLDARDKLIRQSKQADLKKGKYIVGTCPDMCPEKERLMREFQFQVSSFEMFPGTNQLNHKCAVKQYSRSSADQETPLSHELRSESVLRMTMTYLLHNIVHLAEDSKVNVSDWYHFLWDRMRSIRKDITQQNLCSLEAVRLVEQCARFHIHCAARLVAEDPSVFDQKINTENLTKCLQTLKYMYRDLRLDNIVCTTEAEFRAYVVLLNLNDGNFLWEFKQFTNDILKSKELKFALQIYHSIANNNYIRFFELVKQTTYLNACILQRYFTQVRLKALITLLKAYSPKNSSRLSLHFVFKVLAFEDMEATINFLEYYGLPCDIETEIVYLDRGSFYYPDLPFPQERSYSLVESKRVKSIGEVIHGGTLNSINEVIDHNIQNSFNEDGFLIDEIFGTLSGYSTPTETMPVKQDTVFKVPRFRAPSPRQSIKKITESNLSSNNRTAFDVPTTTSSSDLLSTVLKLPNEPMFSKSKVNDSPVLTTLFSTESPKFSFLDAIGHKDISQTDSVNKIQLPVESLNKLPFSFGVSTSATTLVQNHSPVQSKEPVFSVPKFHIETPAQSQTSSSVAPFLPFTPQTPISLPKETEKVPKSPDLEEKRQKEVNAQLEAIADSAQLLTNKIVIEHVEEEVLNIVKSEIEKQKAFEKQEFISKILPERVFDDLYHEIVKEALNEIIENEILAEDILEARRTRMIYKTLSHWMVFTNKRKKLKTLPIYMDSTSLNVLSETLKHPNTQSNVATRKYYLNGEAMNLSQINPTQTEVNVVEIVANMLKNQKHDIASLYWKCLISIPSEPNLSKKFNEQIVHFIQTSFKSGFENAGSKQTYLKRQYIHYLKKHLAVCLKLVESKPLEINDSVNSANGVIFIVNRPLLITLKRHLHALTSSLSDNTMPFAIVVCDCDMTEDDIDEMLGLNDEIQLNYRIFLHDHKNQSLKLCMIKAIKFITEVRPVINSELEMDNTYDCLSKCMGIELWYRLYTAANENYGFKQTCCSNSTVVIDIYNENIDKLIDVLGKDFLNEVIFAKEFNCYLNEARQGVYPLSFEYFPLDWKNKRHVRELIQFLKSLKIQPWSTPVPDDFEQFKQDLTAFSTKILGSVANIDRLVNLAVLEILSYDSGDIPWIHIIRLITLEHFQQSWDKLRKSNKNVPSFVVYNKNEIKEFIDNPWWLNKYSSPLNKSVYKRKILDESRGESFSKRNKNDQTIDINEVIGMASRALKKADEKIKQLKGKNDPNKLFSVFHEAEHYFSTKKNLLKEYENKLDG